MLNTAHVTSIIAAESRDQLDEVCHLGVTLLNVALETGGEEVPDSQRAACLGLPLWLCLAWSGKKDRHFRSNPDESTPDWL